MKPEGAIPWCTKPRVVLCLGAHADDIEIGCGASLLQFLARDPDREVVWVVFSASGVRRREARQSAQAFLQSAARKRIVMRNFRDSYFPYCGERIKEFFETLKQQCDPDLIFTHYRDDWHQDHRLISELTWNTWRSHCILEYEIPKYEGDWGTPNTFVPVPSEVAQRKVALLLERFPSQRGRQWFSAETFLSVMRLRGMECRVEAGYAEAFYGRKVLLAIE
jgi:LmbE family N-acetylglucosaminyl deacetylase